MPRGGWAPLASHAKQDGAMLIVFSGLPGSGKSTIANELARQLPAVVLSMDPIEAALLRCGIPQSFETGVASYEVAAVLAEHQLTLGLTVIADAVNSVEAARAMWRRAAQPTNTPVTIIEVLCSDPDIHQRRLATRTGSIEGLSEPSWGDVTLRRNEWEEWQHERLTLDSIDPLDVNVERALAHIRR